ncbi:MAG: TolC family protein [Myxococcota bacterium]
MNTLFLGLAAMSAAGPTHLVDWLELAEARVPELTAARQEARAAARRADAAGGDWPALQLRYAASPLPIETRLGPQRHRVALVQPVPWLGALDAAAQGARARAQALDYDRASLSRDVAAAVVDGFISLWAVERKLDLVAARIRSRARGLEGVRALGASEVGGEVAVAQAELAVVALEVERARLEGLRSARQIALRSHSGLEPAGEAEAREVPAGLGEGLLPEASEAPTELAAASRLRAREAERDAVARRLRPRFTVGVAWLEVGAESDVSDAGRDALVVELGASFPLASWGAETARREAAEAERSAAEEQQRAVSLATASRRSLLRAEMAAAKENLQIHRSRLLPAARRTLDLARARYAAAASGFDGVVEAEDRLLAAELETVEAEARLYRAQGALLAFDLSPAELRARLRTSGGSS